MTQWLIVQMIKIRLRNGSAWAHKDATIPWQVEWNCMECYAMHKNKTTWMGEDKQYYVNRLSYTVTEYVFTSVNLHLQTSIGSALLWCIYTYIDITKNWKNCSIFENCNFTNTWPFFPIIIFDLKLPKLEVLIYQLFKKKY